jgi:NADH dehydrogenase
VNPEGKTLQLADGQEIPFDQLVLACGGRTPLDIVPGATELALPFRTLNHADQLNQYLRTWEAEGRQDLRLSLVGAGASGVELACKLADRLGDRARLTLIERGSEILREGTPDLRRLAEAALRKREVTVLLQTTVEKIEPGQIFLQPARPLAADLVLWTVGTVATVQPLAAKTDRLGRLMTRPTLQLLDYPEIFALGDGAVGPLPVPVTAQAAIQQADYCAWNLWANRTKLPLLDFQYLPLGQLVSLGIGDAAADLLGVTLDGPVAAQMRRLVYLARMPGLQQQVQVGLNWLSQPIREALAAGGFN